MGTQDHVDIRRKGGGKIDHDGLFDNAQGGKAHEGGNRIYGLPGLWI